jgi:uncharacterized caspase-like protein
MHRNARVFFETLILCGLVACNSTGEHGKGGPQRIALVVGNGQYAHAGSLRNPPNDARAVASKLEGMGWDVTLLIDRTRDQVERETQTIAKRLERGVDAAIFFYAGHGMEVDGKNYLLPIDFDPEADFGEQVYDVDEVIGLFARGTRTSIIFLDACRNNPLADRVRERFARGANVSAKGGRGVRVVGNGLARMEADAGTLIALATAPGKTASDGTGTHSPFTTGLLRYIAEPGLDVAQILRKTRAYVQKETKGKQLPFSRSALVEDFYFRSRRLTRPPPP